MCRNPHSSSMKHEFESKSACRIMVDLLSDGTDHTIQRDELMAASCSSFNIKSTMALFWPLPLPNFERQG